MERVTDEYILDVINQLKTKVLEMIGSPQNY